MGPITPLVEGYEKNLTREKFFITSDPDPSDSFKNENESNVSKNDSEPV